MGSVALDMCAVNSEDGGHYSHDQAYQSVCLFRHKYKVTIQTLRYGQCTHSSCPGKMSMSVQSDVTYPISPGPDSC